MDRCSIAPLFSQGCVYGDGKQTFACVVHHLNCAIREMQQTIPFIGNDIPDYRCPDFEPISGDT